VKNYRPIRNLFEIRDEMFIKNDTIYIKSCTAVTIELKQLRNASLKIFGFSRKKNQIMTIKAVKSK
jgi:hypothetical protein